jgi:predicted dehydrogenase
MSSISKIIRWGIIGCGNVTEVKSGPAFQKTEGFEIVAVMRRDLEKAADYAKRHSIKKHYSNADDLINDPEVDAIYIATPPDSHKFYGLKVALAGKLCYIEKPLASNYQDSLAILNAFSAKNLPLFVAYYRRSLPRFEKIKSWLDEKCIGEIRHVNWSFMRPPSAIDISGEYNWRTAISVAPGGYFDDLASHGLDLFVHLFGEISKASGVNLNQQNLYSTKDAIAATWLHKSGIIGTGSWNFGCQFLEDTATIYGSKGKITFSVFEENNILLETENGKTELFIAHPENVQLFHIKKMQEHLIGISSHPSTGLSAVHTNWVMDQILGENL